MKKAFKIGIILLLLLVLSLAGYIGYQEYIETRPIEIADIIVNSNRINHKSYHIIHHFFNGKITNQRNYVDTKEIMQTLIVKDNKINIESRAEVDIKIKALSTEEVVFNGTGSQLQEFIFDKQDTYLIEASQKYQDQYGDGRVDYIFSADVQKSPQINISNEKPKQGELVKVEVTGVFKDTSVSVEGEFIPSNSLYNDKGNIEIYIPITYYKNAQPYDMQIKIDDEVTPFTLDVQKEQFTQLHFTVSESVTNSTVNSDSANIEYRNKIHPLYKTRDENKYWEGKFIKPVEEKRISSTFGQERYVNNAKTPTRHAGIDYAAPEGTLVYATNNGRIEFSEFLQLTGNTIVIDHGLGIKSYHFHMSSLEVKTGDIVKKGQLIGKVGTTGFSTGPHLHFQISIQNQPINPQLLYNIEY